MDFLKSQLDKIQLQLKGLSATQKMLTASLVAVMVLTLMMWGKYAGTAEMEPMLNQSLTEDDISRITAELDAHHIEHKMDGNRILVPADRKLESLSHAGYAGVLPRNFSTGFDEITKQMSPFASQSTQDEMFKKAKEGMLAQVIMLFPNVKQAVVVIGSNTRRQIGRSGDIEASATISIFMKGGSPASPQLVNAAADVICGGEASLNRSRIKINVDGIPKRISGADDNGMGGGDANDRLAVIKEAEKRLEDKIMGQFSYIQGITVAVAVDLNSKTVKKQAKSYDKDKSFSAPLSETNDQIETNTPSPQSGEPGAQPNVGTNTPLSVAAGGTGGGDGGTTSSETHEKTENLVKAAETIIEESAPAGDVTTVSASVRVPRSYFVNVLRGNRPDAKDPDDKAVDAAIAKELPLIRADVRQIAKLKTDAEVSIATYLDAGPMFIGGPPVASNASVSALVGGHAKEMILGGLAIVSLFMVSMMVRKSGPVAIAAAAPAPMMASGPNILAGGEDIAGEASGGGAALDAVELDDDEVKTQQMLDQVGTLVGEDPDAAAALVKRWLNRN